MPTVRLRIAMSNSRCQGYSPRFSVLIVVTFLGKPKNEFGSGGIDHCLGAAKSSASGNSRQNGPKKTLCSTAVVGSTMYLTLPCLSSSSSNRRRHSFVGATGLCTKRPPPLSATTWFRGNAQRGREGKGGEKSFASEMMEPDGRPEGHLNVVKEEEFLEFHTVIRWLTITSRVPRSCSKE